MTIGQAIRKAREHRGLTQQKLAELSGIAVLTLQGWERDKFTPTVILLMGVADILEISLDELVGRNKVEKNQ